MLDDNLTPEQMRERLHALASGRCDCIQSPTEPNFAAHIVRACLMAGEHRKRDTGGAWSDADTYTLMAWHLNHAAERWAGMALENLRLAPPPMLVLKPGEIDLDKMDLRPGHITLVKTRQPMHTAPKGRAIMLLMPEIRGTWARAWWPGCWSYSRECWVLHLPIASGQGKGVVTDAPHPPLAWMERPDAD